MSFDGVFRAVPGTTVEEAGFAFEFGIGFSGVQNAGFRLGKTGFEGSDFCIQFFKTFLALAPGTKESGVVGGRAIAFRFRESHCCRMIVSGYQRIGSIG